MLGLLLHHAGICPCKKIVCLVVDECHRARGHNDVVMAVKKMQDQKCKFRVLGLSATPGSSNEAIQVPTQDKSDCSLPPHAALATLQNEQNQPC